ncbi:MAG: PKD domain-containing protein, partial [Saprospiraceae bacterium]|nr:PKD domain-containing protein [Saprospiraceae bacterium]
NPPSALLKAAILNTANDLGNAGPDFRFGWGHINVWRAYKLLTSQNYVAGAVDNNGTTTHQVNVPANLNQVRFMIVWADPPSTPQNSKALLNDLDLKVITPDGATTYLPWKLNPTPNTTALNSPAVRGRDSLNNVEQVTISLPAEGTYQVQLTGTDVPFGPQDYHLVWEFVYDSIKLIYPNGGEGFAPGEAQRIQWDAPGNTENFQLSYSTDGGTTFTPIGNQLSTRRMYNWTVPNTVSGTVYFKVSRGSFEDQNDLPFTIVPLAANLEVSQVCPTSMTVQCTPANDTLSYNAYLLGEKYMDLVGTADSNVVTFPITDPASEKWVSMAATYSNGLLGRRQVAYHWPGQLKNCPQTHDLGVRDLIQPGGDLIVTCNSATQPVVIKLVNEGQNPITGATISYQIDDNPPVTESIPDLQVGESIDYTFQTPITLLGNDTIQLKLWSTYAADVISFNDSVDLVLPYLTSGVTGTFLETFENLEEPPVGWLVHNPDQSITWQLSTELANLVGFDGNNTRAIYMDHFNYSDDAAIDYLYMIPFDLMGVDSPQLTFHLAHRGYSAAFSDGLKVEILPGCDFSATPITLFEKYDPDLATAANQAAFYVPLNLSDWQKVTLDLTAYAGQKALVRFVSLNGYGNSLFIDNIGIQPFEAPPMPPVAAFLNPPDSICRQAPAEFSADQISANATYQWNFGPLSIPGTAVGPGPHSVTFATGGLKNVRLIATNPNGADTAFLQVTVLQFPVSSFTFNSNALTTTFTNGSANADSYLWDFGDGFTSTEVDPVHTYASAGTYTVTLSATNECKTVLKTSDVTVNSAVGLTEITENLSVGVAPNPTESDFWVTIHCKQTEVLQFSLIDAQGRLIKAFDLEIHQGINTIPFEGLDLPKGMYQLNLKTGNGQFSLKVAVQ